MDRDLVGLTHAQHNNELITVGLDILAWNGHSYPCMEYLTLKRIRTLHDDYRSPSWIHDCCVLLVGKHSYMYDRAQGSISRKQVDRSP